MCVTSNGCSSNFCHCRNKVHLWFNKYLSTIWFFVYPSNTKCRERMSSTWRNLCTIISCRNLTIRTCNDFIANFFKSFSCSLHAINLLFGHWTNHALTHSYTSSTLFKSWKVSSNHATNYWGILFSRPCWNNCFSWRKQCRNNITCTSRTWNHRHTIGIFLWHSIRIANRNTRNTRESLLSLYSVSICVS